MKKILLQIFTVILINLNAQYQGPVPAITTGYGSFGTYASDTMFSFENTTVPSNVLADRTVSIFYSKAVSLPAPTILIAPGWGQFDPLIFEQFIDFIVSKGCVAVYAPTQSNGGSWFDNHYSGMQMAIDNHSDVIDTTQIGIFGHSVGGGAVAWLGKKFFMDHNYGLNGRFMFASSAWINFEMTQTDLVNFPSDVAFLMQYFEEDTGFVGANGTDPRYGIDIYNNINIPVSEKDFIMVNSSDVSGYHYTTDHGIYYNTPYNALDYYGLFRLVDALIDYKFNGNCVAKYTCLGNGGPKQVNMGQLTALDVNAGIQILAPSHYSYPCDVAGNPRASYCTDSLYAEPFIDYIDSVLINSQSCNELDTGIQIVSFTNQNSCDSVVTTVTSLLASSETTLYVSSCSPSDTGVVILSLSNQYGCDSIITTTTSLLSAEDTILYFSSCDIVDTIVTIVTYNAVNSCDSIVTEVTIPLANSDTTTVALESTNILDTGSVETTYINVLGCDSVVVIKTYWTGPISIQEFAKAWFMIENPIKDILSIVTEKNITQIELFEISGKLVLRKTNNFQNIDVVDLKKGVYFINITMEDRSYYDKILIK